MYMMPYTCTCTFSLVSILRDWPFIDNIDITQFEFRDWATIMASLSTELQAACAQVSLKVFIVTLEDARQLLECA